MVLGTGPPGHFCLQKKGRVSLSGSGDFKTGGVVFQLCFMSNGEAKEKLWKAVGFSASLPVSGLRKRRDGWAHLKLDFILHAA